MRAVLSYLYIAPAIILITIGFGLISLALSLAGSNENRLHGIARVWARWLLRLSFVPVEVDGLEKLDPARNYVLVANHASFMDTPAIIASLPVQVRFFAKLGLFQIPMIGTHLGRAGHFPVDRGNARASLKSMSEAARAIAARNVSVLLFPEGGRSETGLREFKEGAAYIAIKSGVPLLPIALMGTREVLPMHTLGVRPGPIRVRIGDVMETAGLGLGDRNELTARAHQQIAGMMGE